MTCRHLVQGWCYLCSTEAGRAVPPILESVTDREIKQLRAQLAECQRELVAATRNRCDTCGAKVSIYQGAGCPGCGAPECCQPCCDRSNAIARAEKAEAERDAATARVSELERLLNSDNAFYSETLRLRDDVQKAEAQLAAEKARADRLERVVRSLKRGDCWCEAGVGNPMVSSHTAACVAAREALEGK